MISGGPNRPEIFLRVSPFPVSFAPGWRTLLLSFVTVLCLVGGTDGAEDVLRTSPAQGDPGKIPERNETSPADSQGAGDVPDAYGFALRLLEEGRWNQAITEFQRFCYIHPEHPLVPRARLAMGTCYEKLGNVGEAVAVYQTLAWNDPAGPVGRDARFQIGEAFYRAGKYEQARVALERFLEERGDDPWKWKVMYRIAWSSLHLHAFAVAREQFSVLASRDNPYRQPAEEVFSMIQGIKDLPYRSPVLGGLLSTLLPGSGQVYAGAYKDGLLAFLVNGALIAASYEALDKEVYGAGGLVAFVSLTFYAGNIYGAVNSAHHANQERLAARLRACQSRYEWITGKEDMEEASLRRSFPPSNERSIGPFHHETGEMSQRFPLLSGRQGGELLKGLFRVGTGNPVCVSESVAPFDQ